MERAGVTRAGLARRIGVDRSTLSQILSPESVRLPRADTVAATNDSRTPTTRVRPVVTTAVRLIVMFPCLKNLNMPPSTAILDRARFHARRATTCDRQRLQKVGLIVSFCLTHS